MVNLLVVLLLSIFRDLGLVLALGLGVPEFEKGYYRIGRYIYRVLLLRSDTLTQRAVGVRMVEGGLVEGASVVVS